MTAWAACNHIMRVLLEVMQNNEAGILADMEVDSLHDFRIALRRMRSVLSQMHVLPTEVAIHFRTELTWLGHVTSPVRDLDVYLLNFHHYQQLLPTTKQDGLEALCLFLQQKRQAAYQNMLCQLHSPRYEDLKRNLNTFLHSNKITGVSTKKSNQRVGIIAKRRIKKLFKQVLKQGASANANSPSEVFHQLRKRCKTLRYMIDSFQSLYAPKTVHRLIHNLKQLQDNLGKIQDLTVEADTLLNIQDEMKEAGKLTEATQSSFSLLIKQLHQQQATARRDYLKYFKHFSGQKNRHHFCQMQNSLHLS